MKTSDQINEISKAMANAQGEMIPASKSAANPFFKSKYADFTSVWESIRLPLKKNEICVWQDVISTEHGISISTRLTHSSGQWVEFGPLEIPLIKKDPQSVGSAISYGKRYSLSAAVGVVSDEDDDGEEAMNRLKKNQSNANIIKPPQVENLITVEQAKELVRILSECDPIYQKKIWATLKKAPISIETIDQLPLSLHERIKNAALKNRDQYQTSLNNEENEEEVVNG